MAIQEELEKLRTVLAGYGLSLSLAPPVEEGVFAQVEAETGIRLDDALQELYRTTNGSEWKEWLVVYTDELTRCELLSLEECLEKWQEWLPYDEKIRANWGPVEAGRDPRIRAEGYVHRSWFPIAQFNEGGTIVYFDADPAPAGKYGQIIAYQHDPEAVYYVAEDFVTCLRNSTATLSEKGEDLLFLDGEPNF